MKRLYALSKYDFQFGGEVDITANYTTERPGFRNPRGRVSVRGNGRDYQVYVHWFATKGPAGKDIEEVLFESQRLADICAYVNDFEDREMHRMFPDIDESEILQHIAVPDDVADEIYAKTQSILDIKDYWEKKARGMYGAD